MTPILSKPSGAAPASILYITLGALMTVWSGIWYSLAAATIESDRANQGIHYLCMGFSC